MIQVIQAQNVTLAYLKQIFALHKSEDEQFFTEWFDYIPEISELEKQYLDRVKKNYLNVLENAPLLEDALNQFAIRNSQFAITFCDGDFTPTQNVLPVEAGDLNPQSSVKMVVLSPC